MPDSLLSQAIKEAYASAPDEIVILHTIELRHAAFSVPIRVVLGYETLIARLEATAPVDAGLDVEFEPFAFRFSPPDVKSDGLPELELEIDNVSQEIEDQLELAAASAQAVDITYRPYLSTDLTAPHMDPPLTLQLKSVEANDFRVRARAGFRDLVNRSFPGEDYTWTRFPGLIR